jgi:ubiquinone/menaquinone biosynthesis C-methylase UbiE
MPTAIRNHFVHDQAAERYDRWRPQTHSRVVEEIRRHLGLSDPLDCLLDVACGTGHSTCAMRTLAERVLGVDVSPAMLRIARHAGLTVACAQAEALPVGDATFPLLTVGCGFHWFDQTAFLAETRRVLRTGGWLVLYGARFRGTAAYRPAFTDWYENVYKDIFPAPPRNAHELDHRRADWIGFTLTECRYIERRTLSTQQLADYFSTASNVIAAAEGEGRSADPIRQDLAKRIAPLLPGKVDEYLFGGTIQFLQKPK